MKSLPPPYRLCTVEPVSREEVIAAFGLALVSTSSFDSSLQCNDGSKILLHPSLEAQQYFAEFQIQFGADTSGNLSFGLLPQVIEFCRVHGGQVKVLRNGSVLPASGGIMSDVFWSEAFRKAQHLAHHPRDEKA